jgi:hypothetical protein
LDDGVGQRRRRSLRPLESRCTVSLGAPGRMIAQGFGTVSRQFSPKRAKDSIRSRIKDLQRRDVAQPGSAPDWGSGGRGFESRHPDQYFQQLTGAASRSRRFCLQRNCNVGACALTTSGNGLPPMELLRQADARYAPFEPFEQWKSCAIDDDRWAWLTRLVAEARESDQARFRRGLEVVRRVAAIETGAIEGLYEVDSGFTLTAPPAPF